MHRGSVEQDVTFFLSHAAGSSQDSRVMAHANDMTAGFIVAMFGRTGQAVHDIELRLFEFSCAD